MVDDLLLPLTGRPAVARRPRVSVGRRPVDSVMHVGNMLLLLMPGLLVVLLPALLLLLRMLLMVERRLMVASGGGMGAVMHILHANPGGWPGDDWPASAESRR